MTGEDGTDMDLHRLLHDAVDDLEPEDRLATLRERTTQEVTPMSNRRPWTYALIGAAATVAVIGGVAIAVSMGGSEEDPPPAATPTETTGATEDGEPSESAEPTSEPSAEESPSSSPAPETGAVALYFIGDTERAGPRLYREFQTGTTGDLGAVVEQLSAPPLDPDYRTAWRGGQLLGASYDGEIVSVQVDPSVRERPAGMSRAEAGQAVEQVVRTVQATIQERAPVQFRTAENPIDQVYGVPTSEPISQGPDLQVLSLVNLTTPEQGSTVTGDALRVMGLANSFEANVVWEVRRGEETVLGPEPITADGWMGNRLFPFSSSIDVSELAPGEYTLWVTTDDPSGGQEGVGAMTDDKEFALE